MVIRLPSPGLSVFFASPLEAEHVERIRRTFPRLRLLVPADLWPRTRYVADHAGEPRTYTPQEEARWVAMMGEAEVFFDFDRRHLAATASLAPRLRWIQSTSAGIIHYMEQSRVHEAGIIVTTSSGIHAVPLAEWATFAVLWHEKLAAHLSALQSARDWERFCGGEALGRTALVLGYGAVGGTIGRYLETLGLSVYAIGSRGLVKTPGRIGAAGDGVSSAAACGGIPATRMPSPAAVAAALHTYLPKSDYLVIALPGTAATERLLTRERLALLPEGAFIINVGRGTVVDEAAMTDLLATGRLGGAALDVFEQEPLPQESALWGMPNVLINPHSASTSFKENGRIVDIFCENMARYLEGRPLVNVYHPERGY